jgi:hypothetical protein
VIFYTHKVLHNFTYTKWKSKIYDGLISSKNLNLSDKIGVLNLISIMAQEICEVLWPKRVIEELEKLQLFFLCSYIAIPRLQ